MPGRFQTPFMLDYGTKVVAGVSPGHGGEVVGGVPVYDEVSEAVAQRGANTSIVFVPASAAKDSVLESIQAGIRTVVVITEGIPQLDAIEMVARAEQKKERPSSVPIVRG